VNGDDSPVGTHELEWSRWRGGIDEKLATLVSNVSELVHAARETQLREVSRAATATQVNLTLDAAKLHRERVVGWTVPSLPQMLTVLIAVVALIVSTAAR
jgi:hypothetical protein